MRSIGSSDATPTVHKLVLKRKQRQVIGFTCYSQYGSVHDIQQTSITGKDLRNSPYQGWCKVLKTEGAWQHQSQRRENFRIVFVSFSQKLGVHLHPVHPLFRQPCLQVACLPSACCPLIHIQGTQFKNYPNQKKFHQNINFSFSEPHHCRVFSC